MSPATLLPPHVSRLSPTLDEDLQVIETIARDDPMYAYAPDLYFQAGRSALRAVRLGMLAAGVDEPGAILDFACGNGRALRWLTAAFPGARLTASDISAADVAFCTRTFAAEGLVSTLDPDATTFAHGFDVIWCGSLLTHVGEDRWAAFLRLFERALNAGGVVVFTVYGRTVARMLRAGETTLNLDAGGARGLVEDYERNGFGFRSAQNVGATESDGEALVARWWVCGELDRIPALRLVAYTEGGWMLQDVVACARNA